VAELLERAQALVAAGPYDARPAEIAAVHDAIWPEKAPVCPTLGCRQVLGVAYFSIKRWAEQQGAASDAPLSLSTMKKTTSVARFSSDHTIYTPHGIGVAYSNTNLTDNAARYILKNDPDAARLFSELPPEAEEGEGEQSLTPAQQTAEKALEKAEAPTQQVPAGFDYAKLASAMLDEVERRSAERDAKFQQDMADATQQHELKASAGGTDEGEAETELEVKTETLDNGVEVTTGQTDGAASDDHNDEKPVRLSRMNKEQLVATYTTELGQAPDEKLTNDELRDAIAEKRASLQDPE
jgi:hypothetical protein